MVDVELTCASVKICFLKNPFYEISKQIRSSDLKFATEKSTKPGLEVRTLLKFGYVCKIVKAKNMLNLEIANDS